jgi:hypothetical protein
LTEEKRKAIVQTVKQNNKTNLENKMSALQAMTQDDLISLIDGVDTDSYYSVATAHEALEQLEELIGMDALEQLDLDLDF